MFFKEMSLFNKRKGAFPVILICLSLVIVISALIMLKQFYSDKFHKLVEIKQAALFDIENKQTVVGNMDNQPLVQ